VRGLQRAAALELAQRLGLRAARSVRKRCPR
jgi:hypothetical protein